jgi:chromosome partitioning protein
MNVTTVAIQKGGVGKTTILMGIAEVLASRGAEVLAIDTDAQCNLSQWLVGKSGTGGYEEWVETALGHSFRRDLSDGTPIPLRQMIVDTEFGIDLVPASPFQNAPIERHRNRSFLRERVGELRQDAERGDVPSYDVILIDTPPFIGGSVWNALSASDDLLVPLSLEGFPIEGLHSFLSAKDRAPSGVVDPPGLTGIIINRVDVRVRLAGQGTSLLREQYGDRVFSTRLRDRIDITEASTAKQPLLREGGDHARERFQSITSEFLERTGIQI